ncbi:MAG TPA: beta-galactosidase, partial [Porphyromonadaceae bacterium]|nr:beta-galactosidase [Porphyromonadaceae bacterium]
MKQSGMGEQAEAFLKASGALAALCYREEIEMALRTPDFGGFQLLDLQDYPGQGTALVGILDAFMESKGVVSREKWTEFCRDIVPLARFPKYCWYNDEVFTAKIQIAHYGQTDIIDERVTCSLSTASGETFYSKDIHCPIISQGRLNSVVTLDIPLNEIGDPAKITFEIAMKETGLRNSWDIWVYPRYDSKTPIAESSFDGVVVTR